MEHHELVEAPISLDEMASQDTAPQDSDHGLSDNVGLLTLASASNASFSESSPVHPSSHTPRKSNAPHRIASQRTGNGSPRVLDRRSSTPIYPHPQRSSSSSLQMCERPLPSRPVSRKSSVNLLQPSPNATNANMPPRSPLATQATPPVSPPEISAESLARAHFEEDINCQKETERQSKTVVLIHDSCYGHRFARPRTSKAGLGTIVERPERICAGVVGASAAFVRLDGRHAGGAHAIRPELDPRTLPVPLIRIQKTERRLALTAPPVAHVHGTKWMEELKTMCEQAEEKLAMTGRELARPGAHGNPGSTAQKFHEGDLYLCSESLDAFEGALGGVCDAIDLVFGPSPTDRAFVCIRPPGHHCSADFPSGFCWLNNVHVGIAYAAMTYGLTHAAIIDFDLHHGDGSQAITWNINKRSSAAPKNAAPHKKTAIGYFSLHDINSYPCEMGDEDKVRNASLCIENAHGQSIWNVHLQPWKDKEEFWSLYENKYLILLDKARTFLKTHTETLLASSHGARPKAAIFLSAGFDASEWESPGMQRHNVNVPTDFYARFSMDVARLAAEANLGTEGRVISVLEGGYSDRALISGVFSHLSGLASHDSQPCEMVTQSKAAVYPGTSAGGSGDQGRVPRDSKPSLVYSTQWWTPELLEELEDLVNATPPPPLPKRLVEKIPPTYTSPTRASNAKRVVPLKTRLSMSSISDQTEIAELLPSKQAPEVGWATSAVELSKILIPTDRQTLSYRHDELNAEATRLRRERFSIVGQPGSLESMPGKEPKASVPVEGKRMQLRERKGKAPAAERSEKKTARHDRRATIAAASDLSGLPSPAEHQQVPSTTRRLSIESVFSTHLGEPNSDQATQSTVAEQAPARKAKFITSTSTKSKDSLTSRKATGPGATRVKDSSHSNRASLSRIPKNAHEHDKPVTSISHDNGAPSNLPQSSNIDGLLDGMQNLKIRFKTPSLEEHNARMAARAREETAGAVVSRPRSSKRSESAKRGAMDQQELAPLSTPENSLASPAWASPQNSEPDFKLTNFDSGASVSTESHRVPAELGDALSVPAECILLESDVGSTPKYKWAENSGPQYGTSEARVPSENKNQYLETPTTSVYPSQTHAAQGWHDAPEVRSPPSQSSPPSDTLDGLPGQQLHSKATLPVFTSMSSIPFAPKSQALDIASQPAKQHKNNASLGIAAQDDHAPDLVPQLDRSG